jgi:hypothetical protein
MRKKAITTQKIPCSSFYAPIPAEQTGETQKRL